MVETSETSASVRALVLARIGLSTIKGESSIKVRRLPDKVVVCLQEGTCACARVVSTERQGV